MFDQNALLVLISLGGLIIATGGALGKILMTIRNNDLHHVDLRLDNIDKTLTRLEERMSHHLMWHVRDKFPKGAESINEQT